MNKLLLTTAALAISATSAFAVTLTDTYVGVKDNGRTITESVTVDNTTTFTVVTTRLDGTTRTRDFTATYSDDGFDVSGNGKQGFKDFLSAHAAIAQNITVEANTVSDNELAFNAWKSWKLETTSELFASSIQNLEYKQYVDWIDVAETNGIEVEYPSDEPEMTNEEAYILWNENRGNAVYTPYQYVSSIDWISMYNDEVASDEARDEVDTNVYNEVVSGSVAETTAASEATQAEADAEAAALIEASGLTPQQTSTRLVYQAENDISDKSILGVASTTSGVDMISELFPQVLVTEEVWDSSQSSQLVNGQWVHPTTTIGGIDYFYNNDVNINGVREAHEAGWTGEGIVVGVKDTRGENHHGHSVANTVLGIAPGATVQYYDNLRFDHTPYDADVVNHSYGIWKEKADQIFDTPISEVAQAAADFKNASVTTSPNALHVAIHPNITNCSTLAIADCSGDVVAHNTGLLNGTWIFARAGGPGSSYTSYGAGDSDIKYHTLTTMGTSLGYTNQPVSGTSFAAPRITGAAALVMQKYPNLTAGEVKTVLLDSADTNFASYSLETHGRGILDVGAALSPIGALN